VQLEGGVAVDALLVLHPPPGPGHRIVINSEQDRIGWVARFPKSPNVAKVPILVLERSSLLTGRKAFCCYAIISFMF